MATIAREEYLASKVMTATPQQRQVMLIEGAIRFGQQAKHQWGLGDAEAAGAALIRGQEIVCELLAARAATGTPLGRQAGSVYVFVHRALIEAHMLREPAKVDDALRVLEIELETWRAVCQRLGGQTVPATISGGAGPTSQTATPPDSSVVEQQPGAPAGEGRLSIEA